MILDAAISRELAFIDLANHWKDRDFVLSGSDHPSFSYIHPVYVHRILTPLA